MYCSAASRTTQASETFFSLAMLSRVSYMSRGKLIEERTAAVLESFFFAALFFIILPVPFTVSPHYTISVNMCGACLAGMGE